MSCNQEAGSAVGSVDKCSVKLLKKSRIHDRVGMEQQQPGGRAALVKTPAQEFSVLTVLHRMGALSNAHFHNLHWSTGDMTSNEIFKCPGNTNKLPGQARGP